MASVYRAEVSWDAASFTVGQPAFYLSAADDTMTWAIEARRSIGAGVAQFFFYFNAAPDPTQGSLVAGTSSQSGADYTAYDNGGTIAIEKDQALDQLRFITPLGTVTKSLTTFGANDASRLRPKDLALQLTRTTLTVSDADQVSFFDFYGKRDGSAFLGAACTDIDPLISTGPTFSTNGVPANLPIASDNAQTATRFRLSLVYTYPADGTKSPTTNEWVTWAGGDNIGANPFRILLDAACDPISGNLYWVRVPHDTHRQVRFGSSTNGGATLTETAVVDNVGEDYAYPTLAVDTAGRIWIAFLDLNDQTKLWTMVSENYGHSWTTPQSLTLTPAGTKATSLRLRFHPYSGIGILVYRSLTTVEMRALFWDTFDANHKPVALFSPHHQVCTMYGDHYPVLLPNANGRVDALYNEGPDRVSSESHTWGASWNGRFPQDFDTPRLQPYFTPGREAGLTYSLYQLDSSGDLLAFPSDTNTNTESLWAAQTVVSGLLQQYAGLVVGPGGKLYALYQTLSGGIYDVHCKVSDNHGRIWSTP